MIPNKQKNFKLKQNKQPRKANDPEVNREIRQKFEDERQKISPDAKDIFNEIVADDAQMQMLTKKSESTGRKQYQFHQAQPLPPMSQTDYASVFLNPQSTILECQRVYIKFYNECQIFLDTSLFPNIEQFKRLVSSQYYPPLKRYNDLSQLVKQLPEIDRNIDIDVPPATYFFDKPQQELFDMILYLNQSLSRIFQSVDLKEQQEYKAQNQAYLATQELVCQGFFDDIFNVEVDMNRLSKPTLIAGERLVFRFGTFGNFQACLLQQIFPAKEQLSSVFTFNSVKQAIASVDQLRNKDLFKTARNYTFEYSVDGNNITCGFDLIQELLKTYTGISYICHIEDQLSPFVKNSRFWKLREKYIVLVVSCSQNTVTLIIIQQSEFFKQRFGSVAE